MLSCIVVPHFDHLSQFRRILPALAATGYPLLVVDDASPLDTVEALAELLDKAECETTLLRHSENAGKGGAVMTGLRAAHQRGYTHALQIDADGQHDTVDIPVFFSEATRHPDSMICGEPVFDEGISKLRYYGRFLTLSLSWLESVSTTIRDALCGMRLYPLDRVVELIDKSSPGRRMAFDPEILVRAVWEGIELRFVKINVCYPKDGRSHFHYFGDNVEISWMHTRLLAGMLIRLPRLLARKFTRTGSTP